MKFSGIMDGLGWVQHSASSSGIMRSAWQRNGGMWKKQPAPSEICNMRCRWYVCGLWHCKAVWAAWDSGGIMISALQYPPAAIAPHEVLHQFLNARRVVLIILESRSPLESYPFVLIFWQWLSFQQKSAKWEADKDTLCKGNVGSLPNCRLPADQPSPASSYSNPLFTNHTMSFRSPGIGEGMASASSRTGSPHTTCSPLQSKTENPPFSTIQCTTTTTLLSSTQHNANSSIKDDNLSSSTQVPPNCCCSPFFQFINTPASISYSWSCCQHLQVQAFISSLWWWSSSSLGLHKGHNPNLLQQKASFNKPCTHHS